jgi:hypothetical protein
MSSTRLFDLSLLRCIMTGVIVNTRDFYYICIDIPDTFIGFLSSVFPLMDLFK